MQKLDRHEWRLFDSSLGRLCKVGFDVDGDTTYLPALSWLNQSQVRRAIRKVLREKGV